MYEKDGRDPRLDRHGKMCCVLSEAAVGQFSASAGSRDGDDVGTGVVRVASDNFSWQPAMVGCAPGQTWRRVWWKAQKGKRGIKWRPSSAWQGLKTAIPRGQDGGGWGVRTHRTADRAMARRAGEL